MREAELALLGFLLAGCQPAAHAPGARVAGATNPVGNTAAPGRKAKDPPGSFLNEANVGKNSPLARALRGDPEPTERVTIEAMCLPTGEFNLAADGESLRMETWCVERHADATPAIVPTAETVSYRVPGHNIFRISFRNAFVSVESVNGKSEVRLNYQDTNGAVHYVALPARKGQRYSYSFAQLSPDTVEPLGEPRVLEIDR
jgi:hypothetical protein